MRVSARACVGWGVWILMGGACSRSSAPVLVETSTGAPVNPVELSASSAPAAAPNEVPAPALPKQPDLAPPGRAARTVLASLDADPLLRPELAKLREHFGKDTRGPFAVQRVELAAGREGVLVSRADESLPIAMELDRDQLLYAKERPMAGIVPPVVHATIAPAPERGLAVFGYVESMHIVAARMWSDDSNAYSEIDVFHPDACEALTVTYHPSAGWIVACASSAGTRAQRLDGGLTDVWGPEGIAVGTPGPAGRADIAFDGPSTWVLTQRAKAVGGDRTLTFRYDIDGQAL
jgi:hypothetical protein